MEGGDAFFLEGKNVPVAEYQYEGKHLQSI